MVCFFFNESISALPIWFWYSYSSLSKPCCSNNNIKHIETEVLSYFFHHNHIITSWPKITNYSFLHDYNNYVFSHMFFYLDIIQYRTANDVDSYGTHSNFSAVTLNYLFSLAIFSLTLLLLKLKENGSLTDIFNMDGAS